jgi:hypothetical protein
VIATGKTPVLEGDEWRTLLGSIPTTTLRDLRDRALIAALTYSFAPISAALKMKVEDLRARGAEALRAYINAAGIAEDRKGWLFRTARGHKADTLSERAMNQSDAWSMIRRRAKAGRHLGGNRMPHVSRYRNNCLPRQWRRARARAGNGRAREPAHDQALRPNKGTAHAGRSGENSTLKCSCGRRFENNGTSTPLQ